MTETVPAFRQPSSMERLLGRAFGFLVGLALGFSYNHLLQVRGRKLGNIYSTPINLLELNGKRCLVAPRGRTQWVHHAEASGALKKGSQVQQFRLRLLSGTELFEVLRAYLDRFKREVQRYFAVPAGSALEAFATLANSYAAFELVSQQ